MLFAADFRRIAREALRGKWLLAVVTGLVASLLGAETYYTGGSSGRGGSSGHNSMGMSDLLSTGFGRAIFAFFASIAAILVIYGIVMFIIGGAIKLGYCQFNKSIIQETNPQFNDLFSRFDLFGKALGLRILTIIFTFLWFLLFIIPGIIAAYRYSMVFYIMNDDPSVGIMEAIDRSKQMMVGNKWRLFCLQISFIGWAILCLFTCGIGFLWLTPYVNAAEAAFYLEVSGQRQQPYGYNGPTM